MGNSPIRGNGGNADKRVAVPAKERVPSKARRERVHLLIVIEIMFDISSILIMDPLSTKSQAICPLSPKGKLGAFIKRQTKY